MQIFATDATTGMEFSVSVQEDAQLHDLLAATANPLGLDASDVALFAGDEQLHDTTCLLSDIPSLHDGCRLEARRTSLRSPHRIGEGNAAHPPRRCTPRPRLRHSAAPHRQVVGEVHPALWGHTATMTAAVRLCPSHHFHNASAALRANREFALAALRGNRQLYWRLPEALRDDEAVVAAAVAGWDHMHIGSRPVSSVTSDLPTAMRSDPKLVASAKAFSSASDALRGDKAFVLQHIKFMFEHATDDLRSDTDLLLAAPPQALRQVGTAARRDAGIMLALMRKHGRLIPSVEKLLAEPLLEDKAVVTAAAGACGHQQRKRLFKRLSPTLRGDPEVCRAFGSDPRLLPDGGSSVLPSTALEWVRQDPRVFRHLPEALRADVGVALAAVELSPGSYRSAVTEAQPEQGGTRLACAALLGGLSLGAVPRSLRNDREVVLAAVRRDGSNIRFVPDALRDDKEVGLAAVAHRRAAYFPWLSDRLRDDPEVAAAAVAQDARHAALAGPAARSGSATVRRAADAAEPDEVPHTQQGWAALLASGARHYHAVPLSLRGDVGFAALAVGGSTEVYWQLGCALRATPAVAEAAVAKGASLDNIEPPACTDAGVVRRAVGADARNLAHAPERWRDDEGLVLSAVQRHCRSLFVASSRLRGDRSVVLAALRQAAAHSHSKEEVPALLAAASEQLRGDAEVVMCAVECNGTALRHASTALRDDRATATAAGACGLPFASIALRGDVHFMIQMVRHDVALVAHADPSLLRDKANALLLLQEAPSLFDSLPQGLRDDPEVARAARGHCRGSACLSDRAFVLEALQQYPVVFRAVGVALRDDREVVLAAVAGCAKNFPLASSAMQQCRDVVIAAVSGGMALSRVEGTLRNDREVVLAAVRFSDRNIRFVSDALRDDKEVGLAAVAHRRAAYFPWLSDRLRDDPEVAAAAVLQEGMNFALSGEQVRGHRDILLSALQHCSCIIASCRLGKWEVPLMHCASPALQGDLEVARLAVESKPSNRHYIEPCVLASMPDTL